ncbi:hypothetical protein M0802_006761 [Mischocyttarus mexicanus]|nr:hypothetical protein M0802_006761 [Mischocyttarus mexicanus]
MNIDESNRVKTSTKLGQQSNMSSRKRKNKYDAKEEARLEQIVFGNANDVINNLPDENYIEEANESTIIHLHDTDDVESKGEILSDSSDEDSEEDEQPEKKKVAWVDEDDEHYTVETALNIQNHKINNIKPKESFTKFLENKYKNIVGNPKWAEIDRVPDNFDEIDSEILKHSSHLEVPQLKSLPKRIIDIKAMKPINQKTFNEGPVVSSLEFHPTSTLALVAGSAGILSLFQIDGIENNKLYSTQYRRFPISKAKFLKEGTEVILGSQFYSYCHSYNLISGKNNKIPLPTNITNMKKYEISPDGRLIAICGRSGEIYLLTSSSKELIGTLKMNTKCRTVSFTPDSKTIITHGSHEIYIWDVNSRTCIHRAIDDGCLACSVTAISPNGQFLATGSKEGIVNLYDVNTLIREKVSAPIPLKVISNLVTSISALKFNPTSEILAIASDKKPNAFRMLHLPSFNVFSNFPTFQTTMSMPCVIDFSPNSGYLGISNLSYKAFLYRLKHYGNY